MMYTLIESPLFTKLWPDYWSESERGEFAAWLAANPQSGDIIPGSGGIRKVRWTCSNRGKRGGVRIIYYRKESAHTIWLLTLYTKSNTQNIPAHILKALKQAFIHDK